MRQRPSVVGVRQRGVEVRERARRGSVGHAVNGQRSAGTVIACTDDVGICVTSRGGDTADARFDGDGAALTIPAAADAGHAARGVDSGRAADEDIAADALSIRAFAFTGADARSTISAGGSDVGRALDGDIATAGWCFSCLICTRTPSFN